MIRVRGLKQKDLKNRSSKHLRFMAGPGTKPAIWSMSNEALKAYAAKCDRGNAFEAELNRRANNAAKRKTPRPAKIKPTEN